jgi:AraC family cel operon transcriptional repressor
LGRKNACLIAVPQACSHFRLSDFIRKDEAYHFARPELPPWPANGFLYHDHDYCEVFWVEGGTVSHEFNERTSKLFPGQLFLVRPADRHRVTGMAGATARIANVAFSCASWRAVRRRYFAHEPDPFERPPARRVLGVDAGLQAALRYWTVRLADPLRPRVALEGFLMDLPMLIAKAEAKSPREDLPEWLERARREIAQPKHFADGTRAFKGIAGRSAAHVARETMRWLGVTPTDIVNAARMDYAAHQLATTTRPIIDIALECGLTNLSHFYGLFRRRFAASPRRYRVQAYLTVRG